MDAKILATILFRVLGLASIVYAVFYAPYLLLCAAYSNTFIVSTLCLLSYVAAGACLFIFGKRLAALVVMGLGHVSTPLPPPPHY
jgi:hypothetical protein